MTVQVTREDVRIAWLSAIAITINVLESALPSPLPGVKPGLANVITIVALCWFGWAPAAWISLLRVLAGSLLTGTFLSPAFILSLSGALASVVALGLGTLAPGKGLSAIGYSVCAATAHMAGQFWVAYALFIPHAALFRLLPVLMTAALIFGVVSGIIAQALIRRVERA